MQNENGDGEVKLHVPAVRRKRILLVDNDPVDLLFYSFILEHQGYRVKASGSFAEAARLLEKSRLTWSWSARAVMRSKGGQFWNERCRSIRVGPWR